MRRGGLSKGMGPRDGNGRAHHIRGRLTFYVWRPPDLADEEALRLETELTADCDEAVRKARKARALQALSDVEALHRGLTESRSLLSKLKDAAAAGKGATDAIETGAKLLAALEGIAATLGLG